MMGSEVQEVDCSQHSDNDQGDKPSNEFEVVNFFNQEESSNSSKKSSKLTNILVNSSS
jgi:hypothetical protein